MLKGILYGVGVGPGDSSLMTLKAVRVIDENRVIAVPRSKGEKTLALDIVSKEVSMENKEFLYLDFPMTTDKDKLEKYHLNGAEKIKEKLDKGENVVFISLGDISIYSTFGYMQSILERQGYEISMIPGVPSFCAVSSAVGISLTDRKEPVHIIPAVYGHIDEYLKLNGTKVFMKSGSTVKNIKETLYKTGLIDYSYAVTDCGLESQRVFKNMENIDDRLGYFTTIIVKDSKADD